MGRKSLSVVAAVCAAASCGLAGAANAGTSPPPEIAALVLGVDDVPNTILVFGGPLAVGGVSEYVSVLIPNTPSPSTLYESIASLASDAPSAADTVVRLADYAKTKAGRDALGKAFAKAAAQVASSPSLRKRLHVRGTLKITKVVVGAPSRPSPSVVILPITAGVSGLQMHMLIAYVQVDRGVNVVEVVQTKGVAARSALSSLIAAVQTRMDTAFTIANTSAPTIGGTPAAGQTLTADVGSWSGGPTSFAYVWERCAADGSACAPISGATSSTYLLTPADTGATVRVAVTGSNTVSNLTATSTQSVVVG
jgi:hypothetical protein